MKHKTIKAWLEAKLSDDDIDRIADAAECSRLEAERLRDAAAEALLDAVKAGEVDPEKFDQKWDKMECYFCDKPHEPVTSPRLMPCCKHHQHQAQLIERRMFE